MSRKISGWAACACLIAGVFTAAAQPATAVRKASDGIYTARQAQRGAGIYQKQCAECHGTDMRDDSSAAPLAGNAFVNEWKQYSAGDLFERMRQTMPKSAPGSLSALEYADILAHMLKVNGFPPGGTEIDPRAEALKRIRLE